MAVIEINHNDLEALVGEDLPVEKLEQDGSMLGVLFEDMAEDDKISVEVEPNRPDLLSAEGIARALKGFFEIDPGAVEYPVDDGDVTVAVEDSVEDVRPQIACAVIRDLDLDATALNSLIQLQEKLTETYGRQRKKIAIGLHDAAAVTDNITYKAVDPDAASFVPLEMDEELTLTEILEQHEKGQAYGWIVEDYENYPLIVDDEDTVLSFPPVINGVATEVTTDTSDIFLDVTGTSRREVETALNILIAAMHERGGSIEAVEVAGERLPDMGGTVREIDPDYVQKISGLADLSAAGITEHLETLNYAVYDDDDTDDLQVAVPAYRADIMHSYDIIEDVVIGYGYDNVDPQIPDIATIGGQTDEQVFIDRVRECMIGTGAQELMTFILSNTEKLFDRMDREEAAIVEMANPLTEDYTVVRNWLLPSVMETFADNQHNRYPQRVFEVGQCSTLDDATSTGAADTTKLVYAVADNEATFSDVRGVLQSLSGYLGLELTVAETEHPSFDEQRCGTVNLGGESVGVIGTVSDTVLDNWELGVPVVAFELDLDAVREQAQ